MVTLEQLANLIEGAKEFLGHVGENPTLLQRAVTVDENVGPLL